MRIFSKQHLKKRVGTQCLNSGGNLPYWLHHQPPNMPHFTKQLGAPRSCSTSKSCCYLQMVREGEFRDKIPLGQELHHRAHHFIFYAFISDIFSFFFFFQLPPVSEQVLCSVSYSRTLQWERKMWPGFKTFSLSVRPLNQAHSPTHTCWICPEHVTL